MNLDWSNKFGGYHLNYLEDEEQPYVSSVYFFSWGFYRVLRSWWRISELLTLYLCLLESIIIVGRCLVGACLRKDGLRSVWMAQ